MRWIEEDAAGKAVRAALGKGSMAPWQRWIGKQPRAPQLVGRKAAAKILGVQSPHIARFLRQGRMPEPLEVEGAPNVYLREDIKAFAAELKIQRAEDEKRAAALRVERAERRRRREAREEEQRREQEAQEAEEKREAAKERKRKKDRERARKKRAERKKEKL